MQLHNIKPVHKLKNKKRIARGGKRGGYSGRGNKGQKSRAGAKIRPAIRDLVTKFPKQRGRAKHSFKSFASKPVVLNLKDIEKKCQNGGVISPNTLFKNGLIEKRGKILPGVKILSKGEIVKAMHFQNVSLSKAARDKIIKAGGTAKE